MAEALGIETHGCLGIVLWAAANKGEAVRLRGDQLSFERGTAGSKMLAMKNTFTAVIKQDAGWWIGWIEEVPGANCQAKTLAGLVRSLLTTLKEALEMNREEA